MNQNTAGATNYQRLQDRYNPDGNESSKPYVLITGGSDGIGKQMALEFARSGFNLLLVSRSLEKLAHAKQEIQQEVPNASIIIESHDFSQNDMVGMRDMFTKIQQAGLNLKILVNNVGVIDRSLLMYSDPQAIQDQIIVNVYSEVFMTKYFREYIRMKTTLQQQANYTYNSFLNPVRYGEIHLSSFLSEYLGVNRCIYSATKRFTNVFCKSTSFQNFNSSALKTLDYLVVKPSLTKTEMTKGIEHWRSELPENVAYGALRSLGIKNEIYGAWKHESWASLVKYEPHPLYLYNALREGQKKSIVQQVEQK
eukprot:403344314